jgi:hypothetical protein
MLAWVALKIAELLTAYLMDMCSTTMDPDDGQDAGGRGSINSAGSCSNSENSFTLSTYYNDHQSQWMTFSKEEIYSLQPWIAPN